MTPLGNSGISLKGYSPEKSAVSRGCFRLALLNGPCRSYWGQIRGSRKPGRSPAPHISGAKGKGMRVKPKNCPTKGYSGVILVQKSVYSMVSKSPTTSKIFPSRIRIYHV
jgi:hypothetical protein